MNNKIYFIPFFIYFIYYLFYGEIVPENGGYGWDGVIYANITENLYNLISNNQLSLYYAKRVFPPFLINSVFNIFNFDFTNKNIIIGYTIFNSICILFSIFLFIKICDHLNFNSHVRLIGLCSLFVNFITLKQIFFVPVGVDAATYPIGLLFIYSILNNKFYYLILTTFIGSFIWQINIYYGILLILFYNIKIIISKDEIIPDVIKVIFAYVTFISILLCLIYLNEKNSLLSFFKIFDYKFVMEILSTTEFRFKFIDSDFIYSKIGQFITGFPSLFLIFYLIYSYFLILYKQINIAILLKELHFKRLILSSILFLIVYIFLKYISNSDLRGGNSFMYLINWIIFPMGEIGTFFLPFITEYLLLGPAIILIIYFFKSIMFELAKLNFGIFIVALLSLPLILATEPRYIIQAWPFYVIGLCIYLNKKIISYSFTILFIIFSLYQSKLFEKIIKSPWTGNSNSIELLFAFPRQEFYKIYGPWMSYESYLSGLILFIIFTIFLIIFKSHHFR